LPYQDYLLVKPSGFERTKAFLQQKSDSSFDGSSCARTCTETLDEDSDLTALELDTSHVSPINADIADIADISADNAECIGELALQNGSESVDRGVVDIMADMPNKHAHVAAAARTSEHDAREAPHTDYEQMSAENRKRVSEFFSRSRLHHISTWGAEYKAYVAQLQAQVERSILTDVFLAFVQFEFFTNACSLTVLKPVL